MQKTALTLVSLAALGSFIGCISLGSTYSRTVRHLAHSQVRAGWFPTSAPAPGIIAASYTNKVVGRAKKKRHIKHQSNSDQVTSAVQNPPKPPPVHKPPKLANPPKVVPETVFTQMVDQSGKGVGGLRLHISLTDFNGATYKNADKVTTANGDVSIDVPKFPSLLTYTVSEEGRWELADQGNAIKTIMGSEGDHVKAGYRQYQIDRIPVELQTALVRVQTKPMAEVKLGTGETKVADESGVAVIEVPLAAFEEQVDLTVKKATESGTFLGSFPVPKPDTEGNCQLDCSALPLVSLNNLQISCFGPDELTTVGFPTEQIIREKLGALPEPPRGRGIQAPVSSKWLQYTDRGLAFKVRSIDGSDGRPISVVERIRLTSSEGGSVGTLHVSDSVDKLTELFGEGGGSDQGQSTGRIHAYLDDGVEFHEGPNRQIDWIDINRPAPHLAQGADLGIPKVQAKLFVAPFDDKWDDYKTATSDLLGFLESCPGITFVTDEAQADSDIHLSLAEFTPKRERRLGLDVKYQVTESIQCEVTDPGDENASRFDRQFSGSGEADLTKLLGRAIPTILTNGGSASLGSLFHRGVERAKRMALRSIAVQIAQELTRRATFTTRLTSIDSEGGRLEINAGSNQGLIVGSELELFNSDVPAFNNDLSSISKPIVIARVTELHEDSATCQALEILTSIDASGRATEREYPFPIQTRTSVLRPLEHVLDPSTRMAIAKPIYRILDASSEMWDDSGDKEYIPPARPAGETRVRLFIWPIKRPPEAMVRYDSWVHMHNGLSGGHPAGGNGPGGKGGGGAPGGPGGKGGGGASGGKGGGPGGKGTGTGSSSSSNSSSSGSKKKGTKN